MMEPRPEDMRHVARYLMETADIAAYLARDQQTIEALVEQLVNLRNANGRLFLAGLGGSAANASHAAADFRRLCNLDAVCLTDSMASVTACANDDGWAECFASQLALATSRDALFVLSVGGGAAADAYHDKIVSVPLIRAIEAAHSRGMLVFGIVGRDGGYTKEHGDCVIVVPTVSPERVTPHTEGWQGVILHCLVSHPALQKKETKW